ncbi:Ger(x)C family spore germination protein [Psychrobacillus sp. NPDC096426]|uniref:Ger(x)C family spore germination protein n=1 Tax=Psychrobacillus sp. NPDC096426 TaxID=3364491 RepID=UPI00380FED59
MTKKISLLLLILLLLSGCRDERLNKDFASVPMIGFDGKLGALTGYFGLPGEQHNTNKFEMLSAKGISVEDVTLIVDQKINQRVDISKLTSILFSAETAKGDFYSYLDWYYRNSRNRLNTVLIVTDGSTEPFIQYGDKMGKDVNNYYSEFIEGFKLNAILPKTNLQLACTDLLDEGIDLTLPYMKMSNEGKMPELDGTALFSGKNFSGKTLNREESIVLQLMKNKKGKYTYLTFKYDDIPVTIRVNSVQRKMKWNGTKIDISYQMKVGIMEYYKDHLLEEKELKSLDKFLEEKLTKRMEEVLKVLHDANSDALGIGRYARAFHPDIFEEKKWKEKYPTLTITPKVKIKIMETGILD